VKHLSFELGGKNAMIVFPDVDLDAAVEAAFASMSFTVSAGQSCQSTSRLLLHDDIAGPFLEALAARMSAVRVGTAYAPDTDMGPLVSSAQLERVAGYVAGGRDAGARVLTGGRSPREPGYYFEPTLFDRVTPDMAIARDEIFGPVLSALTWSGYDEMLDLANGVDLGLSAAIWTRDIDTALRVAAEVQAGYIWVNDANRHYLGAPFGGVKNSGVGREETADEYATYLETSSVNVKVAPRPEIPQVRTR
jgi:betaine-aldehyde dehydrogenase